MKNPNGYGGISKLPGNRRKPYRVRLQQAGSIKQMVNHCKNITHLVTIPADALP